jgi:hypothetical protein
MAPDPRPGEDDVPRDDAQVLSRATGGVPADDAPDQGSSTGTTPNDYAVGMATGQDVGYAGETGAERRAQWERDQQGHAEE